MAPINMIGRAGKCKLNGIAILSHLAGPIFHVIPPTLKNEPSPATLFAGGLAGFLMCAPRHSGFRVRLQRIDAPPSTGRTVQLESADPHFIK